MSYGIQIFKSNGVLAVDSNVRATRLHSAYTVSLTPSVQSKTFSISGMALDGTWNVTLLPGNVIAKINQGSFSVHAPSWYFAYYGSLTVYINVWRY